MRKIILKCNICDGESKNIDAPFHGIKFLNDNSGESLATMDPAVAEVHICRLCMRDISDLLSRIEESGGVTECDEMNERILGPHIR